MRHLPLALSCFLVACGGGSSNTPATGPDTDPEPTAPDKTAICDSAMSSAMDDHEAAWEAILAKGAPETLEDMAAAACQRFCGRSTECAIEDACQSMGAAEVADLQLDKTAPENTRQCVDQCSAARLTKDQIRTLGTCAQDDESSCETFRSCTAAAQPGDGG